MGQNNVDVQKFERHVKQEVRREDRKVSVISINTRDGARVSIELPQSYGVG
jgi:hypothetical protein